MEEEGAVLNYWPDPPPFYKHFTTENLERLKEIERDASSDAENTTDTANISSKLSTEQILALPSELRHLIPPPPPSDNETFHIFGEPAKSSATNNFTQTMEFISKKLGSEFILSDWSYTRLYPSAGSPSADPSSTSHSTDANIDRQQYLIRFNRSIIIEYLSLLGLLTLDPKGEQKNTKLKHILTLVCNMHALINEYRPHQARETLIRIMEEQVSRKKAEIEGVKAMREKVKGVLEGFGKAANAEGDKDGADEVKEIAHKVSDEDKRKEMQRVMWDAMDEILRH